MTIGAKPNGAPARANGLEGAGGAHDGGANGHAQAAAANGHAVSPGGAGEATR
jgi:hypothetical protein